MCSFKQTNFFFIGTQISKNIVFLIVLFLDFKVSHANKQNKKGETKGPSKGRQHHENGWIDFSDLVAVELGSVNPQVLEERETQYCDEKVDHEPEHLSLCIICLSVSLLHFFCKKMVTGGGAYCEGADVKSGRVPKLTRPLGPFRHFCRVFMDFVCLAFTKRPKEFPKEDTPSDVSSDENIKSCNRLSEKERNTLFEYEKEDNWNEDNWNENGDASEYEEKMDA